MHNSIYLSKKSLPVPIAICVLLRLWNFHLEYREFGRETLIVDHKNQVKKRKKNASTMTGVSAHLSELSSNSMSLEILLSYNSLSTRYILSNTTKFKVIPTGMQFQRYSFHSGPLLDIGKLNQPG